MVAAASKTVTLLKWLGLNTHSLLHVYLTGINFQREVHSPQQVHNNRYTYSRTSMARTLLGP